MPAPSRRLTTLWFADIAGFTRLSATDEPLALQAMEAMQRCVKMSVSGHHGTVIKFLGDGALAEFPSAEGAVAAALEVCARFKGATRAMTGGPYGLHIGIHVGDVTVSADGDIFGDGVNRAARLQSLGQPGQILVSEEVHGLVRRRPELKFESLGEKTAKGLDEPFEVFAVEAQGELVARLNRLVEDPLPGGAQVAARPGTARSPRSIGTGIAAGVMAFAGLAIYTAIGGRAPDPNEIPAFLRLPPPDSLFAMPVWPPPPVRAAASTEEEAGPAPTTFAGLVGFGEQYFNRIRGRELSSHEVLPSLRQALNEAKDGSPSRGRAEHIRAAVLFMAGRDPARTEDAFHAALAYDGQTGPTRLLYAQFLTAHQRYGEADFQIEQAKGKGVSNAALDAARGAVSFRQGQFREAQQSLDRALRSEDLMSTRLLLARALIAQNKHDDAIEVLGKEIGSFEVVPWMAYTRLRAGEGGAARSRIVTLASRNDVGYAGALLLLEAGESNRALATVDRLIRARDPDVIWLGADPEWGSIRNEPRFRQRVSRVLGTR